MPAISSSVKPAWESAVDHDGGKPTNLEKSQLYRKEMKAWHGIGYKGDSGMEMK